MSFDLTRCCNGNVTEGSNGRMEGYAVAMELFMNSPLFGVGAADADLERYGIGYNEIHNTILNFATKFGLLATIPVLLLFVFLAIKIFQMRGRICEEMATNVRGSGDGLRFGFVFH
ncbi:hypothetical protein ACTMU2_37235 [Cupriavidus basilensis]